MRSCSSWLISMGIFCIGAGIFIGFTLFGYGPLDPLLGFRAIFFNTYSIFGYIFLGLGLILLYFKRRLRNYEQTLPQTQTNNSPNDFTEHQISQEDQEADN